MSDFPGGVADVPISSNQLGKQNQVWERPWTFEEMRQASANWSLAADSGLFLFLQDFSQRMLSKTHTIEKQLDGLIRDTKATDSCLHSVFNDFLMLSNTQFIENRVYDEEVEEPSSKLEAAVKHHELEKTREQKEAELIPKMQEAVNYGLRVLDSAFEQLDIKAGNSDSEDEEATDRVEAILEPKDLYVDRPLPYLIGSRAFMEQDDVGLGDLSSDEMSIDSDRDSVMESEDGKEEVQSDDEFDQEEEANGSLHKKSSVLSYDEDEEEDEDSDIFGESDNEEEYEDGNDRKNAGSSSFVDELAARIKGEQGSKPEGDRTSLTSKKKSKGKKVPKPEKSPAAVKDDGDNMFKPPKMEDDDFSPFGGKGGLFSGGKGLFDDDDGEGDLFSDAPERPVSEDKNKRTAHRAESVKSENKKQSAAVSKIPDTSLFGSVSSNASVEKKEDGAAGNPKAHASPKQLPVRTSAVGLFDDEDEDDFFSDKSLTTSSSVGKEKSKPKNVADLFGEDDDTYREGGIFREKSLVLPQAQSDKEVVEEQVKPPEKKMPAGAISMFGPGTTSLLTESLRKRPPSTSEESEKSENGPSVDAGNAPVKQTQKPQTRGLFSDDEDAQIFPTTPKSQSKPEPTRPLKAPVCLFDDEEEEDLFASVTKSNQRPNKAPACTPQLKKTMSLFSDDEDQWLGSKPGTGKPETTMGGMKPSASAPSGLPSAKTPPKGSLFDEHEDDDLFATTKTSSPKKSQRVALLFEEEDDEDKGFLFGSKPTANSTAPAAKTPAMASSAPSLFDGEQQEEVAHSRSVAEEATPVDQDEPTAKSPEAQLPPSPPRNWEAEQNPVGAVSLFGGIDVLPSKRSGNQSDKTDSNGDFLSEDNPPPRNVGGEGGKINVSLFDGEEDDSDWNVSSSIASTPVSRNKIKPAGEQQRTKSTGVFQDEELLFSDTQQKDNDPDVDLFAGKTVSVKSSSVKTDGPSLFADDEDDLFASIKPKSPLPKVAKKPSKPKDEALLRVEGSASTWDSDANLVINPTALLPGAVPRIPGAVSVLPGLTTGSSSGVSSSSLSPSPATTPVGSHTGREQGVSFDTPVQVTTLQSTNKSRAKGSGRRRPQSRAARQQAAQISAEDSEDGQEGAGPGESTPASGLGFPTPDQPSQVLPCPVSPSQLTFTETSPRPSVLSLPVSTNHGKKDPGEIMSKVLLSSDEEDLFGSASLSKHATPPSRRVTKNAQDQASGGTSLKKETEVNPPLSIFGDQGDDLFENVKPRSTAKKAKVSSFMGDDEDDDEDIFGTSTSSTPSSTTDTKSTSSPAKQNIFQEEEVALPKAHKKHKERPLDSSLFEDNVDIFADLTLSSGPKEKPKKKMETRSIFADDMDDMFSSRTPKPVTKAPAKSKKIKPSQETSALADSSNIFDDPLNALGGN